MTQEDKARQIGELMLALKDAAEEQHHLERRAQEYKERSGVSM